MRKGFDPRQPRVPAGSASGGQWTKTDAFMKDFLAGSDPHPFDRRQRLVVGEVGVELSRRPSEPDRVALNVIINYGPKNSGGASRTLGWLEQMADKHGVKMSLDVVPLRAGSKEGKSLNKKELGQWYRRHGFKPDRESGYELTRLPKVLKA